VLRRSTPAMNVGGGRFFAGGVRRVGRGVLMQPLDVVRQFHVRRDEPTPLCDTFVSMPLRLGGARKTPTDSLLDVPDDRSCELLDVSARERLVCQRDRWLHGRPFGVKTGVGRALGGAVDPDEGLEEVMVRKIARVGPLLPDG
jgi:hypothetical protein